MSKNVNKMKNSELLQILKQNNMEVFTTKDLKDITQKNPYSTIKTLKKNKTIEKIRNGVYAITGTDEMKTSTRAVEPSYISFLAALNYHNLTDQIPRKITLATTKRKKHKKYEFATIKKTFFFGYINIQGIIIAEKEKALLDSLYLPKYAGGIKKVEETIKTSWNKLDQKKLINYAKKNKTVKKKLDKILK